MTLTRLGLAALPFVVLTSAVVAQNQVWSDQIGTTSSDEVNGVAPDDAGGFYLTGETWGDLAAVNAGFNDPWLARYDAGGNQTWIRQFSFAGNNFESSTFAAADGAGGAFIGGARCNATCSAVRAWFSHYDGAGNEMWSSTLPGGSGSDGVRTGAAAPAGGLYVGGGTENSLSGPNAGSSDAWFARYDSAGNQVWIRQFGTTENDQVVGSTPDSVGGVYLCGQVSNNGGGLGDAWLARYDSAGNELWKFQFSSGALTSAASVCGDGTGGVYVSGFTTISLGGQPTIGGTDAFVARYDSAGTEIWTRIIGTTSGDDATSVAPNGSGGVYVNGKSTTNTGGNFHDDVWLVRFDAVGNETWSADFATDFGDEPGGVAADGSGGVFVSGSTLGTIGGPNQGLEDVWLARHDGVLASRACSPAIVNSTGASAALDAIGSNSVAAGDLTLIANQIPPGKLGLFIVSQDMGMATPPGSQGVLCLAGNIGRFNTHVFQGPTGSFQVDLASIPVNPPVAVVPGDTWHFQCWYRDTSPSQTTNFTDVLSITFK